MLPVLGTPILERIIDSLPQTIDEVIIVIGYLGDAIKNHFGSSFHGRAIRYVVQEKKEGTFNALRLAESFFKDEYFLMLYADDLFGSLSYERCLKKGGLCVLLSRAEHPERFGVVSLNSDGTIAEIIEKPRNPNGNLVSCGPAVLHRDIFRYPPPQNPNGEYYIPDSINLMVKDGYTVYTQECDWWIPIGYPDDLKKAEQFLKEQGLR